MLGDRGRDVLAELHLLAPQDFLPVEQPVTIYGRSVEHPLGCLKLILAADLLDRTKSCRDEFQFTQLQVASELAVDSFGVLQVDF